MKTKSAVKAALVTSVAIGSVAMAALPGTVWAQSAPAEEQEAQAVDEMVVVGQRQQADGDEPGAGKGVVSQTHTTISHAIGKSGSVFVNGKPIVRTGDSVWMNWNAP